MNRHTFIVPKESAGLRMDQCLARHVPELSRRTAKIALDVGCVFVNRRRTKVASRQVREGDNIDVHLGGGFERARDGASAPVLPEPTLLFEDPSLVVVCKPAGLLTAPTPEGDRSDLVAVLKRSSADRRELYVVHRLDLMTSGILVLAKDAETNRQLAAMFQRHDLERKYDALASGLFPLEQTTVRAPVAGKAATTHLRRLATFADWSWLEATLETGRTHQIRRHLSGMGHPVLADPEYGHPGPRRAPRLALHAKHLAFRHPVTGQTLDFQAPLPPDLATWIRAEAVHHPVNELERLLGAEAPGTLAGEGRDVTDGEVATNGEHLTDG